MIKTSPLGLKFYTFLNRKWFFDKVYNIYVSQFILDISYNTTYNVIDRGIIESFGPRGLYKFVELLSNSFSVFQRSGNFYRLALSILSSLIIIIPCFFISSYTIYYILFVTLIFLKPE